jgi:hypothetical protein
MTTCGAPLVTRNRRPSCSTVASVRLCTGSNGTKPTCLERLSADASFRPASTAVSMASRSSALHASAPASTTSSGVAAPIGTASPSVSLFCVSVPVLSEQSTETPAISSIDSSRDTIAFMRDSASAPSAMVTESTAGNATGMDATTTISTNESSLSHGRPRCSSTPISSADRATAEMTRMLPICSTAFWKCDTAPAICTSLAVRPKKVEPPVA